MCVTYQSMYIVILNVIICGFRTRKYLFISKPIFALFELHLFVS